MLKHLGSDSVTSRKPETIELRFRAFKSDQILVQKDDSLQIKR